MKAETQRTGADGRIHSSSRDSSQARTATFVAGVTDWKRPFLRRCFPKRKLHFLASDVDSHQFELLLKQRVISGEHCEILVWGPSLPRHLQNVVSEQKISVSFIEDGFLRSSRPSASRTPPLSLTIDGRAPYFDCHQETDLERLLKTYDFDADSELLERARSGINLLVQAGVSKYNGALQRTAEEIYGDKTCKRILVIGQVEDDASIRFGSVKALTNNDLVRLAAKEQPDAQIFYKPHPDVLGRVRPARSDPSEVAHLCRIVVEKLPLAEALRTIDHVYTITSLAGFEALLRHIPVTTAGSPFYAGWGLTDDRQENPRRGRKLSPEALFAGAYLLYPSYFDPITGEKTSFEATVATIRRQLEEPEAFLGTRRPWQPWGPYGILGWRHLLTMALVPLISYVGNDRDLEDFRADPILFFRGLSDRRLRLLGRILYPFG